MRAHRTIMLIAALLTSLPFSYGQEPAKPQQSQGQAQGQPPPGRPQVAPELLRLAFFVGAWQEEISYPGREEGANKGQGRWFARPEFARYLIFRYEGTGPEGEYRAMGVLTWDAESQAYRMWWFDDAGGIGEYRGQFRDENTLVLEHHGKVEGRDFRERITYTRAAPGEIRTKIEQAYGNEDYKPYLEATAKRTGEIPRPGGRGGPPQP